MGNDMWHVALEPGKTTMQDVIVANLAIDELEIISILLSTNHLKGKTLTSDRGNYLLMYGGEYERPYPSVMIWKYRIEEDQRIIDNMRQEDGWFLEYVWSEWLMPEGAATQYIPPNDFLMMTRDE